MAEVLKEIEVQSDGKVETEVLPGEGAFYGPKFEYTLRDAINREVAMWNNSGRFQFT